MAWVRLDDSYPAHPKVIAAGADGMTLDVAAMCYAGKYGTDGHVPTDALAALCPAVRSPRKAAARLVAAGRWHTPGHSCPSCPAFASGWYVHDFLDYNPSATQQDAQRRQRAEAGRKGGQRSSGRSSDGQASAQAAATPSALYLAEPPAPTPKNPPRSDSGEPEPGSADSGEPQVRDDARELVRHFAAGVQANGHKLPRAGTKAHRTWLREMDRLLRLDGADPAEVRRTIDYCASDHGDDSYPGEAANVRSVTKLRQRYSQLRLKAQAAERTTGNERRNPRDLPPTDEHGIGPGYT